MRYLTIFLLALSLATQGCGKAPSTNSVSKPPYPYWVERKVCQLSFLTDSENTTNVFNAAPPYAQIPDGNYSNNGCDYTVAKGQVYAVSPNG